MMPSVKNLIKDIEEYIATIKELLPKDHLKVYHMYIDIYNRCYNLNEKDFRKRKDYLSYLQHTVNNKIDTEHAEGLKNGIDKYINNNYMNTVFEFSQMPIVIKNWVGKAR